MPIKDAAEASRCINAIADYLRRTDDSPRAADDLQQAVRILIADAIQRAAGTPREEGDD
jgi:hypothetical protein